MIRYPLSVTKRKAPLRFVPVYFAGAHPRGRELRTVGRVRYVLGFKAYGRMIVVHSAVFTLLAV